MASTATSARRRVIATSWVALLLLSILAVVNAEFNYQVEKRVLERLNDFLSAPKTANQLMATFRANGGFPHNMKARDRDAYLKFEYSLMQTFRMDMLYYGLEDGTFVGHGVGWGTYTEPGNGGFAIDDPAMQKYYRACVNRETGGRENCTMSKGSQYIQCVRNCALMKCADSQTEKCQALSSIVERANCEAQHPNKWCRHYDIVPAPDPAIELVGFIPRTYYCHDKVGAFTQTPGQVLVEGFLASQVDNYQGAEFGNCLYGNKETMVQRKEAGDYEYCGGNGTVCDTTFHGGFRSRDYDPRYRTWYTLTRERQQPNWSPPYPFFSNLDLGITFSTPIYSTEPETNRQVFEGVLAVDYTFQDVTNFLMDSYQNSTTSIVIYEASEPENFIVASSTGQKASGKVLAQDKTQPCPDDSTDDSLCEVIRIEMADLAGHPMDGLLVQAYHAQKDAGYPRELLTVKVDVEDFHAELDDDDNRVYIVQSSSYKPDDGLEWIILVISPAGTTNTDALTEENSLFGLVCVVAGLGFCLCFAMFIVFYRRRNERAVILADWRFTSAFLLGCALLNLSTFILLGPNTDALCLSRMWSFHFLFALALSPLFVKVWRMWRMVGSNRRPKAVVNHGTAVLLSLPVVLVQVLILVIFTFADPPHQEEVIEVDEGIVKQRIICAQNTDAFSVVVIIYEAGLILIGCVLAYMTRNMDNQFGEAKQLMFSMYNIAFIGIIITVIFFTMDIDASGKIVLQAIGIFWGTVFSSAAFVMPRLMRVQEERKLLKPTLKSRKESGKSENKEVRFSINEDSSMTDGNKNVKLEQASSKNPITQPQNPYTKPEGRDSFLNNTGWSGSFKTAELSNSASLKPSGSIKADPITADPVAEMLGTGWSVVEQLSDSSLPMPHLDDDTAEQTSTSVGSARLDTSKGTDQPQTAKRASDKRSKEFNMSTINEGDQDNSEAPPVAPAPPGVNDNSSH